MTINNTIQPLAAGAGTSFGTSGPKAPLSILEIAQSYRAAGLSIIPIRTDGTKAPAIKWKEYQNRIASSSELESWFGAPSINGIGVVCGEVSGGAETIDFDEPSLFAPWCKVVQEIGRQDLFDRLVEVMTPSGGRHLVYRCPGFIGGNEKLAMLEKPDPVSKKDTLIETRGEGGYIVAPGSPASCHELNLPYMIQRGLFTHLPLITPEERSLLIITSKGFTKKPEEKNKTFHSSGKDGTRPGDEFNRTSTWDFLKDHGWTEVSNNGGAEYWRRPGKDTGSISATTNHAGQDLLYIFSSNAHPFEANTGYTKFTAFTLLNHGGDFSAAAQALVPTTATMVSSPPRLDDIGNAERLIDKCGKDLLWISEFGRWFVWTGACWEADATEQVMRMAKQVARSIFDEVKYGQEA